MEAAKRSRSTVALAALAAAVAAAALWASVALAGGSDPSGSSSSTPAPGQVAYTQNEETPAPPRGDCPEGGGSQEDGSSGSGTSSDV